MVGGDQVGFSSGGLSGFWRGGEGGGGVKPSIESVTTQASAHFVGVECVVVVEFVWGVSVDEEEVGASRLVLGVVVVILFASMGGRGVANIESVTMQPSAHSGEGGVLAGVGVVRVDSVEREEVEA